jgi:isoleucyl-tRNA synthetase
LAPFVPFQAEDLHQRTVRTLGESVESVHLCPWPVADKERIDEKLDEAMVISLKIVEGAGALRNKAKVKLRWPLRTLIVGGDERTKEAATIFNDVIKRMANVKEVDFGHASWQHEADGIKIWLDTEMSPELKREAAIRELVRHVQELRKGAKLIVEDRVGLFIKGLDIAGFEDFIKAEVGASRVSTGKIGGKATSFEFEGRKVEVGFEILEKGGKKI